MEPNQQEASSPPSEEQSQPSTDPLAIDVPIESSEPTQDPLVEPESNTVDPIADTNDKPPSTDNSDQQQPAASSSDAASSEQQQQQQPTASESPSTSELITVNSSSGSSNVIRTPPPSQEPTNDPLDIGPSEQPHSNVENSTATAAEAASTVTNSSNISAQEDAQNFRRDYESSEISVSSSVNTVEDTSSNNTAEQSSATVGPSSSISTEQQQQEVIAGEKSPQSETPEQGVASSNDQPTSSSTNINSSGSVSSNNNGSKSCSSSNSSSSSGNSASAGVSSLSAVNGDNSLEIKGISDLSILDVTQGNDDEIEVKVEGGSLMHKVIKFSLLNGMQDSSKRLENSRLIMSGVSNNGEATLATTSSLSRVVLGGAPMRHEEKSKEESFKSAAVTLDNKTTPPACASTSRPQSVEPSSSSSSNSGDSNAGHSEGNDAKQNRTEQQQQPTAVQSPTEVRHSSLENKVSITSETVREQSETYNRSSSLDFREWPQSTSSSSPVVPRDQPTTIVTSAASTTAPQSPLENAPKSTKETEQMPPTSVSHRPKAMYHAELPDFSKSLFSAANLSSSTSSPVTTATPSTTTSTPTTISSNEMPATKSLSQLQMKTPDFSRVLPSTAGSPVPASQSSIVQSTAPRSHGLQIANPDFSKSFAPKGQYPPTNSNPRIEERVPSSYVNQSSFAEISKQRNYISDLQLKNPQSEAINQQYSSVVKGPSSGPSLNSYRMDKPPVSQPPSKPYHIPPHPTIAQLEEPKAHVIHKASGTPEAAPSSTKTWNPAVDYNNSKPYPQPNERERYSQQYPTTGHKGPPPLTSDPYAGYPPYSAIKGKEPPPTPAATHPGGIIVNNVKTYYPEPSQSLPKTKEPEFRLDQKEKQLRQEGTIITLKPNDTRPPPAPAASHYPPQPMYQQQQHAPRSRSPSAERREAQMMASSQEILYRDFKLKQSYAEMPPQMQSAPRHPPTGRPVIEEPRGSRDRSPYDPYYRGPPPPGGPSPQPSKGYPTQAELYKQPPSPATSSATPSPTFHHMQSQSPVTSKHHQQQMASGSMNPPSNWPGQSRVIASPHGGSATSSPIPAPPSVSPNQFQHPKNSPSPVNVLGPSPVYKSPSPSSSSSPSPYPPVPANSITKYTQYYPSGNGERVVSIEVDKESYKAGFKGLDYNMEQKFAEVCQAHRLRENQAVVVSKPSDPYRNPAYAPQPQPQQHPQMPNAQHPKHQDPYRDEYGRPRAAPPGAVHVHPSAGAHYAGSRYPVPQEGPSQYDPYYPHHPKTKEVRRPEQPHHSSQSKGPSPAPSQRYASNESVYQQSKPSVNYGPQQPPSSRPTQHHPSPYQSGGESPHHGPQPSSGRSPYPVPNNRYERPPEKQPTVISTPPFNTQERTVQRTIYPEQKPQQMDPYHQPHPSGHPYQQQPQPHPPKASQPYPQHPPQMPPNMILSNREPSWSYQQQPTHHGGPPQPQPGPSGYGPERTPATRDERQNPVIQPPMNKNIPVKVIATTNPVPQTPSSTVIAPATSTTKSESPLDLSVKTIKTKADSTGSDEYGHGSRSREGVPKVNFNPNFGKHIPERPPAESRQPQPPQPQSYHVSQQSRESQPVYPASSSVKAPAAPVGGPLPPDRRQIPVGSPAIPPGYDKKTDAYMSTNYRAVGGPPPPMKDSRYPSDNRYPQQPGRPNYPPVDPRESSGPNYGALHPSGYPHRMLPEEAQAHHPYSQGSSAPPKSDPYYAKPGSSNSTRNVYGSTYDMNRMPAKQPAMPPKHPSQPDDPRLEDRRFVESMLKKQSSPSADVIADLQAGKFTTRLPTALAPNKKRPAESIPKTSPNKMVRLEEQPSQIHRPYEATYRHPLYPPGSSSAPRDYYPVPVKHEPVSPQPPGGGGPHYQDRRPEAPSITRGVLNTAPPHHHLPPSSVPSSHSQARPIDSHPSVITSYHASRPLEVVRSTRDESPHHQHHSRQPAYGAPPDEKHSYPRPEPFRHGHGDSAKYFGSSLDKPTNQQYHTPQTTSSTVVMQSHIQYGGHHSVHQPPQQPVHQKRPDVLQSAPRNEMYHPAQSGHIVRPSGSSIDARQQYEHNQRMMSAESSSMPKIDANQSVITEQPQPALASPQHRGVTDQSVISKLRNSLEQKERINQLRKQTSSEMSEEDQSKPIDLPPSHFRSKGAMKAYTPIPAFDAPNNTQNQQPFLGGQQAPPSAAAPQQPIAPSPKPMKPEPLDSTPKEPKTEQPPENEGPSAFDILDWGSACNEFVEQLQTGKKRGRRKKGFGMKRDNEPGLTETFRNDLPGVSSSAISEVPQEVLQSASQEMQDLGSSSDEDKPLLLLKQQPFDPIEDVKDVHSNAILMSTKEKLSEKIARNMREKQRLELEQKLEAKLGRSSSSEDESDAKRIVQRSKMRARKLRNRLSVPLKFSDINTDEEDEEEEEEENQAKDLRKRKRLIQTSSESEAETPIKKPTRCQSQVKQENGADMSSDEEDPKSQSPRKNEKTPEIKNEPENRAIHSDSDSNQRKTEERTSGKKTNQAAAAHSSGSDSEKSETSEKKEAIKRGRRKAKVLVSESEESLESMETMTRSKRKLELEKQRSNSKVLRNDKVVGNFVKDRKKHDNTTPQKGKKGLTNTKLDHTKKRILDSDSDAKLAKKRTRKTSKRLSSSGSESSEESDVETMSERLRARRHKTSETSAPSSASKRGHSQDSRTPAKNSSKEDKKNAKQEPPKKRGPKPKKTSKDCASENTKENFYPGWEKELYEYKRSLKVPPQLITIRGRQYVHRISASLPDLDSHHSDESETFSEIVKKINQKDGGKKMKTKAAAKQEGKSKEESKKIDDNKKFSSIIELLHERMLRHGRSGKTKKGKAISEKDLLKSKSEFELLPTPGAESEELFNKRKKSLFDTAIFKSRTRTEQKVMQSKEIIREVFGGDDERPQSAPPLGFVPGPKILTYDEMYNDLLTKSNNVATFLAQKKAQEEKAIASASGLTGGSVRIKIEDLDDETQDSILDKFNAEEGDTPSVASERDLATPVSFKGVGKKKAYKSRRKGSSGFDYIRKKKKPTPVNNNGENSTPVVPKKKLTSAFEKMQSKDESHINKEIRSWVLNKGVGESVLHKAARLGYTDVIVYCLERLEMDPDQKDNAGYTPLHEACAKGHLDICNYLLKYGASHSETAVSGIRPLHEAVENSFIEVTRLLLAFGADPMLATYAGQTPIQLAENNEMTLFLENHLIDIQSMSPLKTGWKFDGPWKTYDPEENGCDLFSDIPGFSDDETHHNSSSTTERSSLSTSTRQSDIYLPPPSAPIPKLQPPVVKKCDSNSNIMNFDLRLDNELTNSIEQRKYKDCAVVLNDIQELSAGRQNQQPTYINGELTHHKSRCYPEARNGLTDCDRGAEDVDSGNDDGDGEFMFEYEEAERPLPPLYLLKDDHAGDKWVLMTDLCNFLKLKSKEAVMKHICSSSNAITSNGPSTGQQSNNTNAGGGGGQTVTPNSTGATRGELIREMKIEEFLSRSSCLQLLCAGEKLNINSNKVILVKYNDNVRNLLQVQTRMTRI
ncbi:mucin-17-like [Uranotaenia lowii]|uniref:mucin-17-like n=1 Tax=Uranotaenia lowii TaxID=190385 RepID=UPI0024791807|nr:mucin-17-like [Uranotaenia lowii]